MSTNRKTAQRSALCPPRQARRGGRRAGFWEDVAACSPRAVGGPVAYITANFDTGGALAADARSVFSGQVAARQALSPHPQVTQGTRCVRVTSRTWPSRQ